MKLILKFIKKELQQFRRDRKMVMTVIVAPIIQLIFLGYAANRDVNTIQSAILDNDKTYTSREFISKFEKSGYFEINYYVTSYNEIEDLINKGKILIAVIIPGDFEKNIGANKTADVQTILDGSDGSKAAIVGGYAMGIVSSYSQNIMVERILKSGIKSNLPGTISPEVRIWYNQDMSTRNYMLPGIVGLLLMIITINLTSLAIVKEREIGTLEQLIVTPIKPYQMIIGKLVPFVFIGVIPMIIVLLVMQFWFGIPIKGSQIYLFFSAFLFMLSTLGVGLFISTISKTQFQAMITSAFGVIMPMMFLSGFVFPIENMPQIVQYITYIIPLRYFNIILRGIVLKGMGIRDLWLETSILFFIGFAILLLSSLRFSKKLK
jgi:ABC-2 type transport system permease protein